MDKHAEKAGLAVALMCQSKLYRTYSLASVSAWIEPAIAHRQIRFAFDSLGAPLAYWTWALLAPDAEHRLLHAPNVLLHESEWNEGNRLWIMDLVAPRGHVRDIVRYIRGSMFPEYSEASSLRRDKIGNVRKTSIWKRKSHRQSSTNTLLFSLPSTAFADSQSEWLESDKSRKAGHELVSATQ